MRIALIIGHSRQSEGASNVNTGETEWEYNRQLVGLIAGELAPEHDLAIIHRDDGYNMLPSEVNETGADIAISFHCNAFDTRTSGTEVLYWHGSGKGRVLAEKLQAATVGVLGLTDRGVKPIGDGDRGAPLLRDTHMPCVLMESFFIDNDHDVSVGQHYKHKLAEAIAECILDLARD